MANGYDGDIKLSVTLSPTEAIESSKKLQKSIQDVFSKTSDQQLDSKFQKIQTSMSKTVTKARELQGAMDRLSKTKIPTDDYKEVQKQIDESTVKLNKLKDRMDRFLETGGSTKSKVFRGMQYDMAELENTIEYAKGELQDLVDTGQAFKLGSDTQQYSDLVNKLGDVNNEMRTLVNSYETLEKREEEAKKKAKEHAKATEQTTSRYDKFSNTVSKISDVIGKVKTAMTKLGQSIKQGISFLQKFVQTGLKLTGISFLMKTMGNAASTLVGKLRNLVSGLRSASSASTGLDNSLGSTIKKFAVYGLGITGLVTLFHKLRSAIGSALTDMSKLNGGVNQTNAALSSLQASLNYLRGAFAAAFQPILTVVAPILSNFIDQIASVVNAIGMLIARLTGATSYFRAVKKPANYAASQSSGGSSSKKTAEQKYQEAVEKAKKRYDKQMAAYEKKVAKAEAKAAEKNEESQAKTAEKNAKAQAKAEEKNAKAAEKYAKAQEKANKQLMGFDELNVITTQDLEEYEEAQADVYEATEYEPTEYEMPELELPDRDDYIDAMGGGDGDPFGLEEVAVETNEKLEELFSRLFDPLKKAWDEAGQYVIDGFNYMVEQISLLGKDMFRDFLDVWDQGRTAEMFTNILLIVGDIERVIGNIAKGLRDAWNYNKTGKKIFEDIRDILAIIIEHVRNVTEYMVGWSANLNFRPLLTSLEKLLGKLRKVADFLGGEFEDIMKHIVLENIEWLIEQGLPALNEALSRVIDEVNWDKLRRNLDKIWQSLGKFNEKVFTALTKVIEAFGMAIADFVNSNEFEEFTTNLSEFLDNISAEDMAAPIEALIGYIEDIAEAILRFVNDVDLEALSSSVGKVWEALGNFSGELAEGIVMFIDNLSDRLNEFTQSDTFQEFCTNLADFINSIDAETISTIFETIAQVILDIAEALMEFVNSDVFQDFLNGIIDYFENHSPEEIAKSIEDLGKAILTIKFASFIGEGFLNFLKFLALFKDAGLAKGLSDAAKGLGEVGTAAEDAGSKAASAGTPLQQLGALLGGKEGSLGTPVGGGLFSLGLFASLASLAEQQSKTEEQFKNTEGYGVTIAAISDLKKEIEGLEEKGKDVGDFKDKLDDLETALSEVDYSELASGSEEAKEKVNEILTAVQDLDNEFDEYITHNNAKKFSAAWTSATEETIEKAVELKGKLKDVGEDYDAGIAEGIESGTETELGPAVDTMTDYIEDETRTNLDCHSPSGVGKEIGQDYVLGIGEGLEDTESLTDAIDAMVESITTQTSEALTEGLDTIFEETIEPYFTEEKWSELLEGFNEFITTKFTELTELLDTNLEDLWTNHIIIWFESTKWDEDIYTPWMDYLNTKWEDLMTWWDEKVSSWYTDLQTKWSTFMANVGTALQEFTSKIDEAYTSLQEKTNTTWQSIEQSISTHISSATSTVISKCSEMSSAIAQVASAMASLSTSAAGMGSSFSLGTAGLRTSGGGSYTPRTSRLLRTFMPLPNIMHLEDDLGVNSFSIPELATGAVIPPNNRFLAVLGDQKSGTNIEAPLDTMVEAFNAARGDEESLLREQNQILMAILEKEFSISSKDVFNAARTENNNFIKRTGRSAFSY